jgi:hypothetical protein
MAWSLRNPGWNRDSSAPRASKAGPSPGDDTLTGYASPAGRWESSMERMSWAEICSHDEFRGRWVALDSCRYDEHTGRATEGAVVDADDDLAELCTRIRESDWKNCAILFCAETERELSRPSHPPSDPFRHSAH